MKFYGYFWVGLLLCAVSGGSQLSTKWILKEIDDHKIKTIDGLLERFASSSLERHLLAYGSESDQFASFESPRVIVYSPDADFIMAFNGEPNSKGYFDLEILKFDHPSSRFVPELISFDPRGINNPVPVPRPTGCIDCHQTDVRPNWDPYFHWVGFYGSEDDNTNAGAPGAPLLKSKEITKYAEFLAKKAAQKKAQQGRYRFLPVQTGKRPNLDFNDRVTCLNAKRVLRAFAEHPLSGRLLPAVANGHLDESRLPKDLVADTEFDRGDYEKENLKLMGEAMGRRVKRHYALLKEAPQGRVRDNEKPFTKKGNLLEVGMATDWRYLFEEYLGIPFRPYSTSRHRDVHLNLGAGSAFGVLLKDAKVGENGKVVLSRKPQTRPRDTKDSYRYTCPRSESMADLPYQEKRN